MFDEISTFSFPTKIHFGCGAVKCLPTCLEESGVRKPLLVTDPGLRATPVVDVVGSVLDQAGLRHEVFDRVHANPIEEDVLESAELYRSAGCDGTIGSLAVSLDSSTSADSSATRLSPGRDSNRTRRASQRGRGGEGRQAGRRLPQGQRTTYRVAAKIVSRMGRVSASLNRYR